MFADDLGTEPVGGRLQGRDIVRGKEGVVVLMKANVVALHFLFHERVAVEPVGGVERKEAGHAHDHGPQNLVPDVEVVVRESALPMCQDAIVGILGRKPWNTDAEGPSLLHAFEDEVDAIDVPLLHAAQCGQNAVLFASALFHPFHRNCLVAVVGFHPVPVIVGALAENFLAHRRHTQNLPEEVHNLLRPGQTAEIAIDDHAVEAVIGEGQKASEQLCEQFHATHHT